MGLRERYDFDNLVNEAEVKVLRELESQIAATPGLCTCQDCVLDMAAYALNTLKPSYRVSLMGSVYAHSAEQAASLREVTRAVQEAIKKIRANPSHD